LSEKYPGLNVINLGVNGDSGTNASFYIDAVLKGYIVSDAADSMIYNSLSNHLFFDFAGNYCGRINVDGIGIATGKKFYVGGAGGVNSAGNQFITSLRWNDGALQWKGRTITFTGGIMTAMGGESGWYTTPG